MKKTEVNGHLDHLDRESMVVLGKFYGGPDLIAVEFRISDGSLYVGIAKKIDIDPTSGTIRVTFRWVQMVQNWRFNEPDEDVGYNIGGKGLRRPTEETLEHVSIRIPYPENPSNLLSITVPGAGGDKKCEEYHFSTDPVRVKRILDILGPDSS